MRSVSPRDLARAAGVSESSVKRWCDQGLIPTVKTAGGHRRLSLGAALEFLRRSYPDANVELLGLPARAGAATADDFYRALISGNEEKCRQIVLDLHLSGERASRMFDSVIAPAFHCIGLGWECGEIQIHQERRGCGICSRVLEELKSLMPQPKSTAALAIGATPECDSYTLPTLLVEIVLRQAGWRAQSLGSRLPFRALRAAILDMKPQLLWLSASHVDDEQRFLTEYREFYARAQADVAIVVGGRALVEPLRRQMEYTAYCDNLQHLEALVKTLSRSLSHGEPQTGDRRSRAKKARETQE